MPPSKHNDDFILRDLKRDIAYHERLSGKQPPQSPPAPEPILRILSQVPDQPLSWLWLGRIPLGHLTLLDAAPGSGLSLVALTLAACVSSGSPLPDGTPIQQGYVLLLAPYDTPGDTLKPRLQTPGGDLSHLLLVHPLLEDASQALARSRPYTFPQDLDHLSNLIRGFNACLLIIDPACAIPGLTRSLPALVELARYTRCAILLTRSLRQAPLDPFHAPAPSSPLLQAARSRLLLAPDPNGSGQQLLLTTKHPLCTQPASLTYDILATEAGIPTIHWLGERDHSQLTRLCTGPLHSPYRQAILHFLQHSDAPQTIPRILEATSYNREAGRKMLVRMQQAGELVSPARGLYTTAHHPCLLHLSNETSPVSHVPNVPSVASPSSPPAPSPQSEAPPAPAIPVPDPPTSPIPSGSSVSSLSPPPAPSPQNYSSSVSNVSYVPSVSSLPNPAPSIRESYLPGEEVEWRPHPRDDPHRS